MATEIESATHITPIPSTSDPRASSRAATGGRQTEEVARANPESIVISQPIPLFNPNLSNIAPEASKIENVDDIKRGDTEKFVGSLDNIGGNNYLMKCSLNDIMFLVMLMMIKSTSDQRQSYFETYSMKRGVARDVAEKVWTMKFKAASEQFSVEKKQADKMYWQGVITIITGVVSAAVSCVASIGASGVLGKTVSVIMKITGRVLQFVADMTQYGFQAGTALAIDLPLAEVEKKAAEKTLEAEKMQTFIRNTVAQLRSMQEAYDSSNQQVQSVVDTIKEFLEKRQQMRLGIVRNI